MEVKFQKDGVDSKEFYRFFENGDYRNKEWLSRQNMVSEAVIIGKKSWGLHVDMWSDGIAEGNFTKFEILDQFYQKEIIIPEPLLLDFYNTIDKKRGIWWEKYKNNRLI